MLKRSSMESNSTHSNLSTIKCLVKLTHLPLSSDDPISPQENQLKYLSVVFVYYERRILIPDFNIYTLLRMIQANIDQDIVEDYVRNRHLDYIETRSSIL